MYLAELEIKKFRCLEEISFYFQPGLNVIVGENNTGKSALIDALRLILSLGTGKRDIFASEDDLHHDSKAKTTDNFFEIHATFEKLSIEEQGQFSLCLAPTIGKDVAQIHMRFEIIKKNGRNRPRTIVWGGEKEGENIPFEILDGIRSVYLEALRDAQVGLKPGRKSRISRLLHLIVPSSEKSSELEELVKSAHENIEKGDLLRQAKKEINSRLKGITGEFMAQSADLRFSPPEFRKIAESIRALVGYKVPLDLEENGLGYNNLLYIATVLGELQQAKATDEIDLAVLLIEEPESHLHPHMQTVLIDYLQSLLPQGEQDSDNNLATENNHSKNTENIGKENLSKDSSSIPVQVFVTSHSPVLASRVDLDSLNIIYFGKDNSITSYPIANCPLEPEEKQYLRRFLDVTKAQLFFARGVFLVEGISEALLLPELARILGHPYPLDKLGISIVNVQSLGFKNFVKLFQEKALLIPAVLVTDADPKPDVFPENFEIKEMSETAKNLQKHEVGFLKVCLAVKTLEYDLALAGNAQYMAKAYKKIRPQKGGDMEQAISKGNNNWEKAKAFWHNFDTKDKAKFAQELAQSLACEIADFKVPPYVQNAINYVINAINGKANSQN